MSGRPGGARPDHTINTNVIYGNTWGGFYSLDVSGTSSTVNGVFGTKNQIYGNGNPATCPRGAAAGLYIKNSHYNRFTYNTLIRDSLQLLASSNNVSRDTLVNLGRVTLESGSASNKMTAVCVQGDLLAPAAAVVFDSSDNNTCGSGAANRPTDNHIIATNSVGNNFNNFFVLNGTPRVVGATYTVTSVTPACMI